MMPILLILAFLDQSVEMRTTFTYDNNLYRYSAVDLDTFLAGKMPDRFPIESADDLITAFFLNCWLRSRIFKPRTTTIRLHAAAYSHAVNHQKDYQTYGIDLRQSFGRWALMAIYRYQPSYLIRYYLPPAGGTDYLACTYADHRTGLLLSGRISRVFSIQTSLLRECENYRPAFTAYNSRIWRFENSLTITAWAWLESNIRYEYQRCRDEEPAPDLSHDQHLFAISATFPARQLKISALEVEYCFAYRLYTTDLPPDQDTPHAGRVDLRHRWQIEARLPIYKHCDFIPRFLYELRRSSSDVYPEIRLKKNYDCFQVAGGWRFYY